VAAVSHTCEPHVQWQAPMNMAMTLGA
jgi:hypothetical protein